MPPCPERTELADFHERPADRTLAARALVAQTVEGILRRGGRIGNWLGDSSLAAVPEPSLDDIAAVDDLTFHEQAIGHGWESFNSGLREDARLLGDILDMVAGDIEVDELARDRRLREQLDETAKAAFRAGQAERGPIDARAKNLSADQAEAAEAVYAGRRHAFLTQLRTPLKMAHDLLATRPLGFEP